MSTHKEAIQLVLDALVNEKTGAIASLAEVNAVGHRIVHGCFFCSDHTGDACSSRRV